MAVDLEAIAAALAKWLRTKPGVTLVQPPIMGAAHAKSTRGRFPMPFGGGARPPSFEIRFTYKDQPRVFRYVVEQQDDPDTMLNILRVHTNGELMVRVPNEYGQLMPNEIYYDNRSASAAALGSAAPVSGNKR